MLKGIKLLYDVLSLPEGLTMKNLIQIKDDLGIVLYQSGNGGLKPEVMEGDEIVLDIENLTKEQKEKIDKILEND